MPRRPLIVLALTSVLAGCSNFLGPSTSSNAGPPNLSGSWSSVAPTTEPGTCTDFHWTVTQFDGTTATGIFTATCGSLQVAGTATGKLSGTSIEWSASGAAATAAGSCPVSLSATAELDGNTIRVPYSGTTCQGAVSGAELITRH